MSTDLDGIDESHRHAVYATTIDATTIDMLTDNVLLEIFDLVRGSRTDFEFRHLPVWKWHRLAHVCHRWRQIIFASPLRLDLQLLCTAGTPVRKNLTCWPAFPIVVDYNGLELPPSDEDSVLAALEHPDRVHQVKLTVTSSLWRKMSTIMQGPFPALTYLSIFSVDRDVPILPGGFLGGSAPCLREILLCGIPIPTLSTIFSSASDLVELMLLDIPQTGYISPAAMVACLALLPKLENLTIGFHSQTLESHVDQINLLPEARIVLPALISFSFEGECAYLEDLVARFDTPRLDSIDITYHNLDDFSVPQLSEFISRPDLKLSRLREAEIYFDDSGIISFYFGHAVDPDEYAFAIHISLCEGIADQVWGMAQVLNQIAGVLSEVVRLDIKSEPEWRVEDDDNMDDIEWLELLLPFPAVETLRIGSKDIAESVARTLEQTT